MKIADGLIVTIPFTLKDGARKSLTMRMHGELHVFGSM